MSVRDTPPRIQGLMFLVVVAILLMVRGGTDLGRHEIREGVICLSLGIILTWTFFRKRMLGFVMVGLSFVVVSVGLTALFHPSVFGIALTIGAILAAYFLAVWDWKRHPELGAKD